MRNKKIKVYQLTESLSISSYYSLSLATLVSTVSHLHGYEYGRAMLMGVLVKWSGKNVPE